ncbi:ATP-grasp domain-containing protein [Bacillus sp. MHSD_36]|uniref:ATP-grasp domain-containing protein n=1 Tax=unclassified Bacillus (in: firmicutes) TaxID=185979 RepID=UPI002741FFF7|nr:MULTISPECIES: ATP-grasp domain-containing protein [unclassified Bacillus (in: firmicutes)]MDP7992171.1 ATP-grasp domain-containing protein [Bacillus sp. MHSD_36]MDR4980973.1 ATP-grasp domain-containing protein [Bacillus sp. MHSD_37]
MFTGKKYQNEYNDINKKTYNHFYSNQLVDIEMLELFRNNPYRKIIALSELDILRAARLREKLGIGGQNIESATAFRNKIVMKDLVSRAKFKVPKYRELVSVFDLYEFIEENNFPIVIKPVDGMGSRDTFIFYTMDELKLYLEKATLSNVMVEEYIEGDMYHIDGLFINHEVGFVSVGKYSTSTLSFKTNQGQGTILLHPNNEVFIRLKDYIECLVKAFPTPKYSSFHCEVFLTKSNDIIFCEIASRTAGGRVSEAIHFTYGIDLNETWIKLECGLQVNVPTNNTPTSLAGMYFVPKKAGFLKSIPEKIPFDWIVEYIPLFKEQTRVNRNMIVASDSIATVVFSGENEIILQERLAELVIWFEQNVIWEE